MLDRLRYYAPYAWHFVVARDAGPLICGIAITDRCNLSCHGCHVSNTGAGDLSFERVRRIMRDAWDRGCRELYFTGGEPMLWRDGDLGLNDAIAAARNIGYFHVHVYTNGTQGLGSDADLLWVSMDGLPDIFARRRGDHFEQVESAVRSPGHPPVALIYTVDRYTAEGLEPFLRWVRDSALPVKGVMIYFHTPYYGKDDLYLDAQERGLIVRDLRRMRRAGLPVLNTAAGLSALESGDWKRRTPIALVFDAEGESVCCRASDDVCVDCGYGACTEIDAAQRLRPSAVLGMAGYL